VFLEVSLLRRNTPGINTINDAYDLSPKIVNISRCRGIIAEKLSVNVK
jgi:hypothetical protein